MCEAYDLQPKQLNWLTPPKHLLGRTTERSNSSLCVLSSVSYLGYCMDNMFHLFYEGTWAWNMLATSPFWGLVHEPCATWHIKPTSSPRTLGCLKQMERQLIYELPHKKSKWEPNSTLDSDQWEGDLILVFLNVGGQLAPSRCLHRYSQGDYEVSVKNV